MHDLAAAVDGAAERLGARRPAAAAPPSQAEIDELMRRFPDG